MKRILLVATIFLMQACATTGTLFGPTPEAQIVNGANVIAAAATLGTVLLKNDKITVAQARSYRAILGTADSHLKDADRTLLACRAKTGSTAKSAPDPCAAGIETDIRLAVAVAGEVKAALDARQ